MGVPLNKLLELVPDYPIKPVAGRKGLSNPVSWVHMVGSAEIAEFLKGEEIAFTTGVGLREDMTLLTLTETIYEHRASAMVINIGPYIKEIPPEIIDFGNEHDFPIFEVPWEVHMADIMRIFSRAIQEQERTELELSTLIRCALSAPEREDLYVPGLSRLGYAVNGNYTVFVYRIDGAGTERKNALSRRFANLILQDLPDTGFFVHQDTDAAVASVPSAEAEAIIRRAAEKMAHALQEPETMALGIGSTACGLQKIAESHRMASLTLKLFLCEPSPDPADSPAAVCTYSSLGTAGLLFHIRDREVLETFYKRTVKPLEDYDRTNNGNLTRVLEAYLRCSGSVQMLAERFFVHRNTINYKLRKIEQILGCDLSRFSTHSELEMGLLAGKIKDLL